MANAKRLIMADDNEIDVSMRIRIPAVVFTDNLDRVFSSNGFRRKLGSVITDGGAWLSLLPYFGATGGLRFPSYLNVAYPDVPVKPVNVNAYCDVYAEVIKGTTSFNALKILKTPAKQSDMEKLWHDYLRPAVNGDKARDYFYNRPFILDTALRLANNIDGAGMPYVYRLSIRPIKLERVYSW
jgi:hypothetical protein